MNPRPKSVEEAIELFLARRRAGESLDAREFAAQHAELGPDLDSALQALTALEHSAPATRVRASLGAYRIVREVGRGGMGVVYEALEEPLGRRVALKVLPPELVASASARARLKREAQLVSRLEHSGIATVYGAGVDSDEPWIAMRFVEGRTLAAWIEHARERGLASASPDESRESGPGAVRAIVECIARVARTLQFAHEQGVVHRDVKPSNIAVGADRAPVLLDFGLAVGGDSGTPTLTHTGHTVGTPAYFAPELVSGERARPDAQCDVYALGVTLYECLTLRRPFDGPTPMALLRSIESGAISDVRSSNADVSSDLSIVVATAMEREPGRRYATAAAFAADLEACAAGRSIVARRARVSDRLLRWMRREPRQALLASSLVIATLAAAGFAGNWLASRKVVRIAQEVAREQETEEALLAGYSKLLANEESDTEFAHALELEPGNIEALAGRVLTACLARRWSDGARLLEHAPRSSGLDALRSLCARGPIRQDAELAARVDGEALDYFLVGLGLHIEELHSHFDRKARLAKRSLGMLDEAVKRSRHARSYYHVARSWAAETAHDERVARSSAAALVALWPDSHVELCSAGRALISFDPEAARPFYERAVKLDPQPSIPLHQLGVIEYQLGRYDAAEPWFRRALARWPSSTSWSMLGASLYLRGCRDEGQSALELALRVDPRDRNALLNAGRIRLREDVAASVPLFERMLELDDADPDANACLGFALFSLGHKEEGRDFVARSIAQDGTDPEFWYWLALDERELGERERALDVVDEALRRFRGDRRLAGLRDELERER